MIFASRTPADLVRTTEDDALVAAGDFCSEEVYGQIPSKLNNEPNPILVAFREHVAWRWVYLPSVSSYAEDVESFGLDQDPLMGATAEHVDHARRVLSRLARLTEGASA